MDPVAPRPEFLLADSLRIADENLPKTNVPILYGLDLDFLAESHSIARKIHFVEGVSPKHPHARL